MSDRRLATLFVIVLIDMFGFGLILPLLPYYADTFGADPGIIGILVASYSAMQLIGSPILSRLSDVYGRRPVLLVSIFGTALGFLLMGFANSLLMLFASRILDGLTGGNISVAQAYIADITDEKSRAKSLGIIGAAFGLGIILGPALGGILSIWGYAVPAFVAAGMAGLNLLAVYLWLPESLTQEKLDAIAQKPKQAFSIKALKDALGRPHVGPLLYTRFFYRLAFGTFEGIFVLFAQYHLLLSADITGYILAYVGMLIVMVQGLAIGFLTARFQEKHLIFWSTILMMFSLLLWAYVPSVSLLLIVLIPLALSGGILNTVINSSLSKSVPSEEVGGILGLSVSMDSLSRVIAPAVGGYLLEAINTSAPGVFGSAVLLLTAPYIWRKIVKNGSAR